VFIDILISFELGSGAVYAGRDAFARR